MRRSHTRCCGVAHGPVDLLFGDPNQRHAQIDQKSGSEIHTDLIGDPVPLTKSVGQFRTERHVGNRDNAHVERGEDVLGIRR